MLDWGKITVLFTDVDGVLTDGSVYFGVDGQAFKRYNVHDGYGIRRLVDAGVRVVFVSGDEADMIRARAERLGVREAYLGVQDKGSLVRQILERDGIPRSQACYIGDDVPDIPAMAQVGVPVAVANARPEVKAAALYVTSARGGEGAVREVCDLILQARQEEKKLR
ncbi:MAG: HAD hydrolase family protein [Armatimonadetes bacterium]|nr:HAD hydrolase family protein [Armatimonadota bacterium]